MADWNLLDSGFGYNVVAVFGSQSTGKSMLRFLAQLAEEKYLRPGQNELDRLTANVGIAQVPS